MRSAYLLYLATRPIDDRSPRCCEDRPPETRSVRPPLFVRLPRKLRRAIPSSAGVFRRTIRVPLGASSAVGSPVTTARGHRVGRVEDIVIGIASGRASYAVATGKPSAEVVLLPDRALRAHPDRDGLVLDVSALDEPLRDLLLAG
jgi:PRC-barrel domain protein